MIEIKASVRVVMLVSSTKGFLRLKQKPIETWHSNVICFNI